MDMKALLRMVAEGGLHSVDELARRMGVAGPLLEAALPDLARMGYLRAADEGCAAHCGGCPAGGCSPSAGGRLWTLTEKGIQAAQR